MTSRMTVGILEPHSWADTQGKSQTLMCGWGRKSTFSTDFLILLLYFKARFLSMPTSSCKNLPLLTSSFIPPILPLCQAHSCSLAFSQYWNTPCLFPTLVPLPGMTPWLLLWLTPSSSPSGILFLLLLKRLPKSIQQTVHSGSFISPVLLHLLLPIAGLENLHSAVHLLAYLFTLCPYHWNRILSAIFSLCFPSSQKRARPRKHSINANK